MRSKYIYVYIQPAVQHLSIRLSNIITFPQMQIPNKLNSK